MCSSRDGGSEKLLERRTWFHRRDGRRQGEHAALVSGHLPLTWQAASNPLWDHREIELSFFASVLFVACSPRYLSEIRKVRATLEEVLKLGKRAIVSKCGVTVAKVAISSA